jgi:hypothetical protein
MTSARLATASVNETLRNNKAPERVAVWHKSGTIERIARDSGSAGGARLHALEKFIAILLLGYASSNDRDPRCFRDEHELVAEAGMDRKTFSKYIASLQARKLIVAKRDRSHGAMTYYLRGLVDAFREGGPGIVDVAESEDVVNLADRRTGKLSRSENQNAESTDREALQPVRETASASAGKSPGPDRESFPDSIELVSIPREGNSHELHALARRFGLNPSLFDGRPHRIAGALAISQHCANWGITYRRLRSVTAAHGFREVAGAVGYVLTQIDLGDERAERGRPTERAPKADDPIRNPAALFEAALKNGWSDRLPGLGDDPYLPEKGYGNVDESLWLALNEEIRNRVSTAFFDAAWKHARLKTRVGNIFTVEVPTTFAENIARKDVVPTALTCLARLGYTDASIVLETSERTV